MSQFAVVGKVELPEGGTIEEGRKELESEVIPRLKQAPGFVSAIFLAPPQGREGLSVAVYNTKEDADNAKANVQTPPNIKPISFEVREVAASA